MYFPAAAWEETSYTHFSERKKIRSRVGLIPTASILCEISVKMF